LLNQFHDILPGSHIHPVYEDAMADYREISDRLDTILAETAGETYFNTLPVTRDFITFLADEAGDEIRHGERGFWAIPGLPGLTAGAVAKPAGTENWLQAAVSGDTLRVETPFYRIAFGPDGSMISLYDRELEREWVKEGCGFNKLHLYEDRPGNYDAWDILPNYKDVERPITVAEPLHLTRQDGVSATFETVLSTGRSTWKMLIRVYAVSRAIEVEHIVDWDEKHKLAKINFGPEVLTRELVCDTSAGFIRRELTKNTTWQQARFEVCHHKWCDMSESGGGVALINEGKYGVGLEGDEISLSLLRATIRPDITSDIGHHDFCYVILPHEGDFLAARVNDAAMQYNVPLRKADVAMPASLRESICASGMHLQAMKLSEDGGKLVIRLSEQDGRRGVIHFPFPVEKMNLIEDSEGTAETIAFKPFELLTVAVAPEQLA
ncbi:MAG: glycoside hydrolase family 38 C-terminal domain-containing protein, partial [Aristaeellaceae bacterium]